MIDIHSEANGCAYIIEENDMESHILKEKGIGYSYGIYGSDLKILS